MSTHSVTKESKITFKTVGITCEYTAVFRVLVFLMYGLNICSRGKSTSIIDDNVTLVTFMLFYTVLQGYLLVQCPAVIDKIMQLPLVNVVVLLELVFINMVTGSVVTCVINTFQIYAYFSCQSQICTLMNYEVKQSPNIPIGRCCKLKISKKS